MQRAGQLVRAQRRSLVEQYRYDALALRQCAFQLPPGHVVRIVEPTRAGGIGKRAPFVTDQDEHGVRAPDALGQPFAPVATRVDALDIDEDVGFRQRDAQPIVDAPRVTRAFAAPVTDEDVQCIPPKPGTMLPHANACRNECGACSIR